MRQDGLPPSVETFWFKVVDFLQTNWAIIEAAEEGVHVVFIQDASGIFDQMSFGDEREAERQLRLNGFRRFVEEQRAKEFLSPPPPPYRERPHPNGPIYSSGRFWRVK